MSNCKEYFDTDYTPIEWTPKIEANFYQTVLEHKLDGRNRNFLMLSVLQRFKELTGLNVPSIQLWDKLFENLNLDYADKSWNQRNPPKIKDPLYLLKMRPELSREMEKRRAEYEISQQNEEQDSPVSTPKTPTSGGKLKKIKDEIMDDSLSTVQKVSSQVESTKQTLQPPPKSKGSVGRPKKGDNSSGGNVTSSNIKTETTQNTTISSSTTTLKRSITTGSSGNQASSNSTTSTGNESAPRRGRKASSSVSKSEIDDLTNSIDALATGDGSGKNFTESESVISSDTASTSSKHDDTSTTGERPTKRGKFSGRHSAAAAANTSKSTPPKSGTSTVGSGDNTMIKKLRDRVSTSGSFSNTHAGKKRK